MKSGQVQYFVGDEEQDCRRVSDQRHGKALQASNGQTGADRGKRPNELKATLRRDSANLSQRSNTRGEIYAKDQTKILQKWFLDNIQHPYLKNRDKQQLANETGLSHKQISGWFTNNRKRKFQKVINAAKKKNKDFGKFLVILWLFKNAYFWYVLDYVREIMELKFNKNLDQ